MNAVKSLSRRVSSNPTARVQWQGLDMKSRHNTLTDALRTVNFDSAADLVVIGGDLTTENLIAAYTAGIYPWPKDDHEILSWWCPDPRCVVVPEEAHIGRTVRKEIRREKYRITMDAAFGKVIRNCQSFRSVDRDRTWITPLLRQAYCKLHDAGYAHSVEAWDGDTLVGGLYGVSIGRVFFGESMFTVAPNASKVAFASLIQQLRAWGFDLIDCQQETPISSQFGSRLISRKEFLRRIEHSVSGPTRVGLWRFDTPQDEE